MLMGQAWHWALLLEAHCCYWDRGQSLVSTRARELFSDPRFHRYSQPFRLLGFGRMGQGFRELTVPETRYCLEQHLKAQIFPALFSMVVPICNAQRNKWKQLKRSSVIMIQSTWLSLFCSKLLWRAWRLSGGIWSCLWRLHSFHEKLSPWLW